MMKIAVIVPGIVQLGPIIVMVNLVNSLKKNSFIYQEVFYLDKSVDPDINIEVPTKKFNLGKFNFKEYDIIHTTGLRPDLIAFIYRRKIKCHVSTIHNFVFADLKYTYNKIISYLFGYIWLGIWSRADRLICVSGVLKDYYSKWFTLSKLGIIYNGISIDKSSIPDDSITKSIKRLKSEVTLLIGTAAILTKRKGIEQLLYLLSKEPGYGLVIIGEGKEYKKLEKLSEKLKITERCLFTGFLNHANRYFPLFDVFIHPSRSEGFGLSLIEAIQKKIPVVCSDIEVFNELTEKKHIPFFKLDNIQSLAEAVNDAQRNNTEKLELAAKEVNEKFSSSVMADNYFNLYQSLLS